jgi:hypothetical protein
VDDRRRELVDAEHRVRRPRRAVREGLGRGADQAGRPLARLLGAEVRIPIQRARCTNVHGQCVCITPGVIRHSDVTAAGFGTHTDPGENFPMDDFLDKGRWYAHNGWTT